MDLTPSPSPTALDSNLTTCSLTPFLVNGLEPISLSRFSGVAGAKR